jgi:hypothetical protein
VRRYDPPMRNLGNDLSSGERSLLRHTLATLAYRAEKPLREPPADFAGHRPAAELRIPLEIVGHLGDLLEWAESLAQGHWTWKAGSTGVWDTDVERFYSALARLDAHLASDAPLGHAPGVIFQGPIADALTHVGQLTMLRRIAGSPVRPESYGRAHIVAGRVGRDQSAERREFDGDASGKR